MIKGKYKDIYKTKNKYKVIYADPPWQYGDKQKSNRRGGCEKYYRTMSAKELMDMEDVLKRISEKDSVLFMWVTSPFLFFGKELMEKWGFKYKSLFIWNKVKHNMGHYNSVRHEFLLIGTKGKCTPENRKLFNSIQTIERSDKHSEKPERFREIIDTLYPSGKRIELFSRKIVDGWHCWGDEVND